MKKHIVLLIGVVVLTTIICIIGCSNRASQAREREMRDKARYATRMNFTVVEEVNSGNVSGRLHANRTRPDEEYYTGIVFVHTFEESKQFDEHILVAWPRVEGYIGYTLFPGTDSRIRFFNGFIRHLQPDIDFRDYGLPANEITIIDAVENWEIVNEIITKYNR